jgi:hypothetical protein
MKTLAQEDDLRRNVAGRVGGQEKDREEERQEVRFVLSQFGATCLWLIS